MGENINEEQSFADFVASITGGDENEVARLTASYDQHQAFTAEKLSMLDAWVTASLVAIEQGHEQGSAAAMMRARIILEECDYRELQMLLMTLMATYISAKTQLDDETVTDRLRSATRNEGFEIFQRYIVSGGKVCMHCGEDAETGYCEEALQEAMQAVPCICGECPQPQGDHLEEMLNRAFAGGDVAVPDDLSDILPPADGSGEQK